MKVIIIEEPRFKEILDRLKLEAERFAIDKPQDIGQAIKDTQRLLHYHLVKWMQSHGASCID